MSPSLSALRASEDLVADDDMPEAIWKNAVSPARGYGMTELGDSG